MQGTTVQAEIIIVSSQETLENDKKTAQQVAQALVSGGVSVREQISVCFDRSRLQQAIATALGRSQLLVTVGGLGGPAGFLCKQVMSEGLRIPLVHNEKALQGIQSYCRATGTPFYPEDVTFASLPKGSRPLMPRFGKLPGCVITAAAQQVILLPATGQEGATMLTEQVLPGLSRQTGTYRSVHSLHTYGIAEPQVRRMLVDLMGTSNPTITLSPKGEELEIKVTAQGQSPKAAAAITSPVLRTIAQRMGDYAYGLNVPSLEAAVIQKMRRKELNVSIAEAGTGGLLGQVLEQAEGGRSLVRYHVMAETNETKTRQLGIPAKTLRRRGDVSEYTAVAMAHGALLKGRSSLGVGICADIPGAAQQEAAQVYIAVCDEDNVYVKKLVVAETGAVTSEAIIEATVGRGLNMLRLFVDYLPERYHGSVPLEVALSSRENITDSQQYRTPEAYEPSRPLDTPKMPMTRREKKQKMKAEKAARRLEEQQKKAQRPKRKAGKMRKVVFLLAVVMFFGSASYLGLYKYRSVKALELRDDMAGVYASHKFMGLKQYNKDVVAYISIDDTNVTYPIVQAKDNAFYLRRDFTGEHNNHGIPFMDSNVDVYRPSDNMVVYGHNMMDGTIFGELLNYRELEYYKAHPVINFDTITPLDTAREGKYKIMSVFITNTYEKHGPIFNYHKNINMSPAEMETYIRQLELRSLITTPVDTKVGDELITLSTCDYNFSGSRFVVVARRVRPGESASVNTEEASINPEPLLPDVWYNSFGGTRPNQERIDAAGGADGSQIVPISSRREYLSDKIITTASTGPALSDVLQPLVQENKEESSLSPSAEESTVEEDSSDDIAKEQEALEKERLAEEQKAAEGKKKQEAALAAQKAAEEQKAKEAAAEILRQETIAKEQEILAKEQADIALMAQNDIYETKTSKEGKGLSTAASGAADKAATAATEARTAATIAATEAAKTAATGAENYAKTAKGAATVVSAQLGEIIAAEEKAAAEKESSQEGSTDWGDFDFGTLKVNGTEGDALEIVSRIVQNEIGSYFHEEAVKAQAVAAYTYVAHNNAKGATPSVGLASKASSRVTDLVAQVLGEAVYYNGALAFTPYHATSAGKTTTSSSVWGGSYPYLVVVDSSVDQRASGYERKVRKSASAVSDILYDTLNISTDGTSPENWFEILSYEPGDYVGRMSICGETVSPNGNTITGRLVRESVLNLRSASFTIDYDSGSDEFTFTTYGYGHGVGLSQTGANFYAQDGWGYRRILEHYYPGCTVK